MRKYQHATNVVELIFKYKMVFVISMLISLVAAIVKLSLSDEIYKVKTTIYLDDHALSSTGIESLNIQFLGGNKSNKQQLIQLMLNSRSLKSLIAQKMNLVSTGNSSNHNSEKKRELKAIENLERLIKIQQNKTGGIDIYTSCNKPQFCFDLAKSLLASLNILLAQNQRGNVAILQEQVDKAKINLTFAEERLESYREKNPDVFLSEKSNSTIDFYADLRKQLSQEEMQYAALNRAFKEAGDVYSKSLTRTEMIKTETRIFELHKNLRAIETEFQQLPKKEISLARLQRDFELFQVLYLMSQNQLGTAKLESFPNNIEIVIIDPPFVPQEPISQTFKVIGTFIGISICVSFTIALFFNLLIINKETNLANEYLE